MYTDPVKVLFFDIGGVLLTNGWGYVSRKEAAGRFDIEFMEMEELHQFIFNVYEIGKITLEDYLNIVIFHRPRKFNMDEFKSFMFSQSLELPHMLRWLKAWKVKYPSARVVSINNEGKELNDFRIKKFGLHQCFDAFISSGEVGMRKPDPGIFRLALGVVQTSPEHCIYFDDRIILVEAAKRLGIKGYHHVGFESTRAIIEKELIMGNEK